MSYPTIAGADGGVLKSGAFLGGPAAVIQDQERRARLRVFFSFFHGAGRWVLSLHSGR